MRDFYCDFCDKLISKPFEGIVEFITYVDPVTKDRYIKNLTIVHQAGYSPLQGKGCSVHHAEKGFSDEDLNKFTGEKGFENLARLKERIHPGHMDEFIKFAERFN